MTATSDMAELVCQLKAGGQNFAVATVIRTVSVTAAKPGAKAVIDGEGLVIDGWIGGGCARHAVIKAARRAIAEGKPCIVSIQPEELLAERGLASGDEYEGRLMASNHCPSKGTMDIFVEPVLANPELLILGSSPVASMIVQIAAGFGFSVSVMREAVGLIDESTVQAVYEDYSDVVPEHPHRYVLIATQGSGDVVALSEALRWQFRYVGFVGSRKKMAYLEEKLFEQGCDRAALQRVKAPAGLDIGAVSPLEIALSVLAEIVQIRRTTVNQEQDCATGSVSERA